jgi:hypothetical protein
MYQEVYLSNETEINVVGVAATKLASLDFVDPLL